MAFAHVFDSMCKKSFCSAHLQQASTFFSIVVFDASHSLTLCRVMVCVFKIVTVGGIEYTQEIAFVQTNLVPYAMAETKKPRSGNVFLQRLFLYKKNKIKDEIVTHAELRTLIKITLSKLFRQLSFSVAVFCSKF